MNNIAEGVRLIRGTSCNQPDGVEHVLVTSGVGVPTGAVILGKMDLTGVEGLDPEDVLRAAGEPEGEA